MDIDSLFKTPKYPASGGGNKRKMPDNPTPEMLKKMRMEVSSAAVPTPERPESSPKGKQRATVEDAEDEDAPDHDDFAPGGDADYFAEEDEEGRFYGGGLTSEQKDIMNIFDRAGGEGIQDDPDELSITSIRRLLLKFERAANKNQDQRSKYPDDPTKFIDSEADLDGALKALLPLAQAPALAYPEIVRSGTIGILIGLLSHENADIVIDVVEVVHELTDEDVGNEDEDTDEEQNAEALKVLIEGLLENSILELLVDNLTRLNESEESDRQGVFHILGIFENILGFDPKLATPLVQNTKILSWLLTRIKAKTHDDNRGYAAELLSILMQNNQENRLALCKEDGIEVCLTVVSLYRKRDPRDAEETEFLENVYGALCSALSEPENKKLFVAAEGPDLMILIMKEKLQSRVLAVKTLDFAMSGSSGSVTCESFVSALGLKSLFSVFMGQSSKKQKGNAAQPASEVTGHVLSIIASLLSNLASESTERIRLLTKFVENTYEKVDKLMEIRDSASARLRITNAAIEQERKEYEAEGEKLTEDEEVMWYLRRLDGGLFTLQTVDYILAWIAMEDDGIRTHMLQMLSRKNQSMDDIVRTLQIYYDNVDEDENSTATAMEVDGEEPAPPTQREILLGLIQALGGPVVPSDGT